MSNMECLLHIPSGEFVRFVKVDNKNCVAQNGAFYIVSLTEVQHYSWSAWRMEIKEWDNLPLLLNAVCSQLPIKYNKSEFEVVSI